MFVFQPITNYTCFQFLKAEKKSRKLRLKARREKELTLSKTRELGQVLDSEHMSEYTEEESDTNPPGYRLRGFLKFDALYLRPFLCRKVTHQEVTSVHTNKLLLLFSLV